MDRKALKALLKDAPDETIDAIMADNGRDVEKAKGNLAAVEQELKTVKDQLKTAGDALENLKDAKPEELKKQIEDLQLKARELEKASGEKLAALRFEHSLEAALLDPKSNGVGKVKDVASARVHLDVESLKKGYDEKTGVFMPEVLKSQMEKLKSSHGFLLEPTEPAPEIVAGAAGGTQQGGGMLAAMQRGAGLSQPQKKE